MNLHEPQLEPRFPNFTGQRTRPLDGLASRTHNLSNMPTHRIHLRGPWDIAFEPMFGDEVVRRTLPNSWQQLFGNLSRHAVFRRSFHRPTNLEPHEIVRLTFQGLRGTGRVFLNDFPLGPVNPGDPRPSFDITMTLLPTNRLQVDLDFDPGMTPEPGGMYEAVALEIIS